MRNPLYRISLVIAIALPLLSSPALFAQTKKKVRGPRAIAIVRWQADAQGKAKPTLVPIAIRDEDKFFDASLYRATPVPMALEAGTVYEAQQQGQLLGYFTVQSPLSIGANEDRHWIGNGDWKNAAPPSDPRFHATPQVATKNPAKAPSASAESEDTSDLHKKTTTVYNEEGKPQEKPTSDEPPTMKKKGDPEPVERSPQVAKNKTESKPTNPDEDSDRPKLKRQPPTSTAGTQTSQLNQQPSTAAKADAKSPQDNDPNRPILKRGRPAGNRKELAEASIGSPLPIRVAQSTPRVGPNSTKVYEAVAVSDADESIIPQDYRFRASEDEKEEFLKKMTALAQQQVNKFLSATPSTQLPATKPSAAAKPTSPRKSVKPSGHFEDIHLAMLDPAYNNTAELVFTARYKRDAAQSPLYVTVVARTDVENNPRQLFYRVTSQESMDFLPRLDFIDAVDVDGDGPAELLFRQSRSSYSDYVIFRAGADKLEEVFHGGAAD